MFDHQGVGLGHADVMRPHQPAEVARVELQGLRGGNNIPAEENELFDKHRGGVDLFLMGFHRGSGEGVFWSRQSFSFSIFFSAH